MFCIFASFWKQDLFALMVDVFLIIYRDRVTALFNVDLQMFLTVVSQLATTSFKLTIKAQEQGVKYVQI